jgi:hypothetical protein
MPEARSVADHDLDEAYHQHAVRAVPLGPPSEAQLEKIRTHVVDLTILEEHEPFNWMAQASNTQEDAYATVMDRTTLDNFAVDAEAGVAFMNSHRTGGFIGSAELPLGRTFDAKVIGASSAGPTRLDVTSYTLRGLNLTGLSTDAFIDGMRSGIVRDVSVGFYGGEYRCSICDKDMRTDWTCRHWPGRSYPKLNSKGEETGETVRAVARIVGAHLAEISAVYDGATPGCMVSKAKRMAEAGEIRAETIDWLEQRYRIKLPHPGRSFAGVEIPTSAKEAEPMDLTPEQIAAIRLALTEAGQAPDADIPIAVRAVVDEFSRLRPLADEGRQYRADLVEQAISEGKRAHGTEFAEETYRGLLGSASLETVKRMRDDWKAVGDKQFPGGRQTVDANETVTPIRGGRRTVPAAARG